MDGAHAAMGMVGRVSAWFATQAIAGAIVKDGRLAPQSKEPVRSCSNVGACPHPAD
jgi:hypothetical protein